MPTPLPAPVGTADLNTRNNAAIITVVQCVNTLDVGGVEQLALTLARTLDHDRFRSVICCIENRGSLADEAEREGTEVHALQMQQRGKWPAFRRLCELLDAQRPCVIHSHNFKPFYYAALARLLGHADAHIHTRHGAFTRNHRYEWRYRLMRACADELVTVSHDGRRKLARASGLALDRINVLPNGVDLERFSPAEDKVAVRRQLKLTENCPAIVTVARLSAEKDLGTLLRAFALLTPAMPEAELWIVGDGPERTTLEKLSRELDVALQTRFMGARADVPDILRAADVFALSSISEGLSIALIEAAASGLPIVATDVGGNREIVEPPHTGVVVPMSDPEALADALQVLLGDLALRTSVGAMGRARVEGQFSLPTMIDRYSELYTAHV